MRRALVPGAFLAACLGLQAAEVPRPAGVAEASKPPVFAEVTARAGIAFTHSIGDGELSNIVEGTGSGACVLDFDGDGFLDVYFPNGRWLRNVSDNRSRSLIGKLRNALYKNDGDGTFTDVTEKAGVAGSGYGFGCSAADYDDDGDVDLYVLNYDGNQLFRNDGRGTFTDVTDRAGLRDGRFSLNAPWFDYDRDGDLDVFVCNYLQYDDGAFRAFYPAQGFPGPLSYNGVPSALYRNDGDGKFTDVTKAAGVFNPGGRCMSAVTTDLNGDGLLDVYQANDSMESYYYVNKGDGTFEEKGLETGVAYGQNGQGVSHMGPFSADVDGDGRLDLFIPDMDYATLLLNRGEVFDDAIGPSGLAVICGQYTGWGAVLADFDADGDLDLFLSTGGAHHEYPEDPVLARNDGKGRFTDVARGAGDYFGKKYVARGATWADFDNDGDVDLLVVDLVGPARLLENRGGTGNRWLMVDARVPGGKRTAIGARLTLTAGGRTQVREVTPVNGYLSQGDPRVHFGLGAAAKAERLEIRWPDGRTEALVDVPADQVLKVVQKAR
ncbi:CRTAC1 family protein [Acidobacteria bacterium ACD]|nr:MAG: CRTAC1 family protein [Acidobacteriota bacterium]MCE7958707.1 CRTAC1 family protein [Acidobacteria bacterium ACB2]MDL1951212.1 CRTAC1 family protein [Acidobacteria bacterium ACD]